MKEIRIMVLSGLLFSGLAAASAPAPSVVTDGSPSGKADAPAAIKTPSPTTRPSAAKSSRKPKTFGLGEAQRAKLKYLQGGFLQIRIYDIANRPTPVGDNFGKFMGEVDVRVPGWHHSLRLWPAASYKPPSMANSALDTIPFITRLEPGQFMQYIVPINHLLARPRPGHLPRFTVGIGKPVVFWYQWRHWIKGAKTITITATPSSVSHRSNAITISPSQIPLRCFWLGQSGPGELHFHPVVRTKLPRFLRPLEKKMVGNHQGSVPEVN